MNSRDVEELGWAEHELGEVFIAFVRRHRRMPSRRDLERFRQVWLWEMAV